jgi:cytochrome b6-f complex iron-sulfur subunit
MKAAPEEDPKRRDFLANIVLAAAGLLTLGGFAARFFAFLYPDVPPEKTLEVPVIARNQIPANGGVVVHLPVGHVALLDVNGEIRAFSAVCTHLGCLITWQPTADHVWYCPCHKGKYDREGHVVSGPPPRPLTRYPVSVRDGRVFVTIKVRQPMESA